MMGRQNNHVTKGGNVMKKNFLTSLFVLLAVSALVFTVSCSKQITGTGPGVTSENGTTTGSRVTVGSKHVAADVKHLAATQEFPNEDINFEFDSYRLLLQARENLRKKAQWLLAHPEVAVVIEGHCDERGMGGYNLALGDQRANKVKEYLIDLGVQKDRLATISYGEERPLDPRHHEEAWSKNRRAHFR
jgi:peptidoglycan-associated lipoprotein